MATQILMPALSPTMEEGKLAKWLVKEGDTVKSGDILAEIETDKATMEFEAVDEGRIGKLLVPEGTEGVKVNAPIATLARRRREALHLTSPPRCSRSSPPSAPKHASRRAPKPAPKPVAARAAAGSAVAAIAPAKRADPRRPTGTQRIFASPLARRIAQQKGIDLAALKGSGPRGRIVKADVETAKPGAKAGRRAAARAEQRTLRRRSPASRRCPMRAPSSSRRTTTKSRTTRCARRLRGG